MTKMLAVLTGLFVLTQVGCNHLHDLDAELKKGGYAL